MKILSLLFYGMMWEAMSVRLRGRKELRLYELASEYLKKRIRDSMA